MPQPLYPQESAPSLSVQMHVNVQNLNSDSGHQMSLLSSK
jgi:hypothetical protein